MSGAIYNFSSATFLKLQLIHSLWLIPLVMSAPRVGQAVLQSWVLPALGPGVGQQISQVTTGSASACLCLWPAVSLSLVIDPTIFERAAGGNRGLRFLVLPWQVPFRLQGRCWVCPPSATSLSLPGIISLYSPGWGPY